MSRFISLSSTIRILAILLLSRVRSARSERTLRSGQPGDRPPQNAGEIIRSLFDDVPCPPGQQFPFRRAELLRCQDHNGNIVPLGTVPYFLEKSEPVHSRHHRSEEHTSELQSRFG